MGRHGIARSHMHDLVHASEGALTYELRSSQETRVAFPFDFALRMTYAITGDQTLEQRFEVLNTGTGTLPFTLGGHPAFNVPLVSAAQCKDADGEAFEDYQLEFARPWRASSPHHGRRRALGLWPAHPRRGRQRAAALAAAV